MTRPTSRLPTGAPRPAAGVSRTCSVSSHSRSAVAGSLRGRREVEQLGTSAQLAEPARSDERAAGGAVVQAAQRRQGAGLGRLQDERADGLDDRDQRRAAAAGQVAHEQVGVAHARGAPRPRSPASRRGRPGGPARARTAGWPAWWCRRRAGRRRARVRRARRRSSSATAGRRGPPGSTRARRGRRWRAAAATAPRTSAAWPRWFVAICSSKPCGLRRCGPAMSPALQTSADSVAGAVEHRLGGGRAPGRGRRRRARRRWPCHVRASGARTRSPLSTSRTPSSDVRAAPDELAGRRQADAAGGARDEHGASGQLAELSWVPGHAVEATGPASPAPARSCGGGPLRRRGRARAAAPGRRRPRAARGSPR